MFQLRSKQDEIMDGLDLSGNELSQTMNGLSMLNRLLGNKSTIINAVKQTLGEGKQSVRIIDLGCGGGDTLRAIADVLRVRDTKAQLVGIDGNPSMLEYATELSHNYPEISYQCRNILSPEFSIDHCDILVSTQFIYRFEDQELVHFLQLNKQKVSRAIIFCDLQRHWLPYMAYMVISTILPFSHILKNDGLLAIKRSYTRPELQGIFQAAECEHVKLHWRWAFRYLSVVDFGGQDILTN